ncbi:putative phage abortive infection protein [Geobacter sp. DSM 9736]|uniref:putative phage abortive infection protein n=1 Tax=Geobacter sp. DSM 9736 TaxID=1277350 RepID=UPI000B5F5E20|nr:putative phage abortive infection protein [Geobacter sp. DSM 9736]SNB46291.1 Putative phage abortive infection protein [Geobacter sp. DSM 9736]
MRLISETFSKWLIGVGLALVATFVALFLYKSGCFDTSCPINTGVFGQFGDTVGGLVGSLWALAGVVLFYINLKEQRADITKNLSAINKQTETLELQRVELELQRKENERTREVFEQQKRVLEEQSKTVRTQQFESNFYSLLDVFIKIRNNLDALDSNRSFFATIQKIMHDKYENTTCPIQDHKRSKVLYEEVYFDNKGKLSHYLQTIYRIIKIIDESTLNDKSKFFYSKIIRSQFSENELLVLYYNSHITFGLRFYPLILRYNLLKHLPCLTKLELKSAELSLGLEEAQKLYFMTWMDVFLEEELNPAYEDMVNSGLDEYLKSRECRIVNGLTVEIKIVRDIAIGFHFSVAKPLSDDSFKMFMLRYLYDRLYFSRYLDVDDPESITMMSGVSGSCKHYIFTVKSQKELKVNSDLY